MVTHTKAYNNHYYKRRRQALLQFFGGKCNRCGELYTPWLELHHVNGANEPNHVRARKGGWGTIHEIVKLINEGRDAEIELLCQKCHTKEHNAL